MVPVNVTLFGNRVLADVIKLNEVIKKREIWIQTGKRRWGIVRNTLSSLFLVPEIEPLKFLKFFR